MSRQTLAAIALGVIACGLAFLILSRAMFATDASSVSATADPASPPETAAAGSAGRSDAEGVGSDKTAGEEPTGEDPTSEEPTGDGQLPADGVPAGTDTRDWDGIDACRDGILPDELDPVVDDIEIGGPYDYPGRDGTTFGNRETFLPAEEHGYYREFTVETPGLDHRGAKRVVTGGDAETDPDVWYYTDDHYETFCEFAPAG